MNLDGCLKQLADLDLLPTGYQAAFVVGSVARGWQNPGSDLDIYLATEQLWTGQTDQRIRIAAAAEPVPVAVCHVDGRRWEIKYWLGSQIEAVIEAVSPERFASGGYSDDDLSDAETVLLARIPHALPLHGAAWLAACQERIRASAFRTIRITGSLNLMDTHTEDAVGLLDGGDVESAVIAAREAFRHAVAALLADAGELFGGGKWRARAYRAASPAALSFADYWAIETMVDFDQSEPRRWVEHVLTVCQQVSMSVEI